MNLLVSPRSSRSVVLGLALLGAACQDGTRPDWGRHFDTEIARILAAGGAKNDEERFWLEIGYFTTHLVPERIDQARHIADLMGIQFLRP